MITDSSFAVRMGAKARARKSGPRKFVSTLVRISSSVWVRMPALDTEAPALLISTVTSGAAWTAAWMEAGSVTSRARGTMRSSSQLRGLRAVA
jgi:hypothetical protein